MRKKRSSRFQILSPKRLYSLLFSTLVIFSISANQAYAGTLTASVDRNRIGLNETLVFTLAYDEQVSTNQLNFNSLQQDFDILSIRPYSSNNVSIINGQTKREISTTWTLTLAPRKQGALVIPSFNVNGDISDAIRIDVVQGSAGSTSDQPILVSLSVDKQKVYVGEQLLVNVEIAAQSNVSNLSGEGLKLDDAEVELIDRQSFQRIDNGIAWQVEQLSYAVFPDEDGILAIPALLFSGLKADPNQRRNPFDPFRQQSGQRIAARSDAIAIEILPAPASNSGSWIPASGLEVQSSWSGDTSQVRVGEPITRTIEMIALGQRSNVIPPLDTISSPLYKAYKDQPQIEDKVSADFGIVGIRRESEAIVPSIEGTLDLPEQRISWWNTETNSWQETILPKESLEVLPAIAGTSFAPPEGMPQFLPELNSGETVIINQTNLWWQVATALLALVCAIQLWIILRSKTGQPVTTRNNVIETKPSEKQAWRKLENALKSDDNRKIKTALLEWSKIYFEGQSNLNLHSLPNSIAIQAPGYTGIEQLRAQLVELDASLYKGQSSLEISQLKNCLKELRKSLAQSEKKTIKNKELPSLYPS